MNYVGDDYLDAALNFNLAVFRLLIVPKLAENFLQWKPNILNSPRRTFQQS